MVVFFLVWFGLVIINEESDEEIYFINLWVVYIDNEDFDVVNSIV